MHKRWSTLAIITIVIVSICSLGSESYAQRSTFEVTDDRVLFKDGDKVVKTVLLKPKTPYGDSSAYTKDEVFFDQRRYYSHYLLIYRNFNYPDRPHTPPINGTNIEIYDNSGNRLFVIDNMNRRYNGLLLLFSEDWAVIVDNDEGMISGYGFIQMKDKTHRYVSLPVGERGYNEFVHAITIDQYQTGYSAEKDVVWIISRFDGREIITEIASDGSYRTSELAFR